jgi:hypothetical protein
MSIPQFRDCLITAITHVPIQHEIRNETEFEKLILIPILCQESLKFKNIHTYIHPWNNRVCCQPSCTIAPINGQVQVGCPRCWAESKKWSSVTAFGTHNTFDAVARDDAGKTLAIEAKLVATKNGKRPSSEIQRMLGQCCLAKSKHDFVLGVCGVVGGIDVKWDSDTDSVLKWFDQSGIKLIFKNF